MQQFSTSYLQDAITLAENGQITDSISQVETIYKQHPELRDGFSCIASVLLDKGLDEDALKLLERDFLSERLSPPYRHLFAHVLSVNYQNNKAISAILRSYTEDPSLMYGFSLVNHLTGKSKYRNIIDYAQQNEQIIPHNYEERLQLAFYYAQTGNLNQAEDLIEEAYSSDNKSLDGYAFIGSIHLAFIKYKQALFYYNKDRKKNRLSPKSRILLAKLLAHANQFSEAELEILRAYDEDETLLGGFSLIGCIYRNSGKYDDGLCYFEKDKNLNRLSPAFRHIFADHLARKGRLSEAQDEVEIGYSENPTLLNGYARLGNIIYRDKKDLETAFFLYKIDHETNRLSPRHRLVYAELLSHKNDFDGAIQEVNKAYSEDQNLMDGLARCAWQHFWPKKDPKSVIDIFLKDQKTNRLSPEWMLNLAQAFAAIGNIDKAKELVVTAYQINPILKDGFARCAWQHFWPKNDFKSVIHFFIKDQNSNRLSPPWMLNFAKALAITGNIGKAKELVASAYQINSSLKDGFAQCAWIHYWPKKDYESVIEFFDMDLKTNRLSPVWMLNFAQAFAATGNIEKAKELVAIAYQINPTLTDGFARCAWQHYWPKMDFESVIDFFRMDQKANRLSPEWMLKFAQTFASTGDIDKAGEIVATAYQINPTLKDGFTQCAWHLIRFQKHHS